MNHHGASLWWVLAALLLLPALLGAQTGEAAGAGNGGAESAGTESAGTEDGGTESGAGNGAGNGEAKTGLTEEKVIALDIKTSTLQELADWCRRLGLSEGGGREELAARLRAYYRLEDEGGGEAEGRLIIIESARSTEYFTLDEVDEEYARLRGNVVISLNDGGAIHRISADEILYNRTRNLVTARGSVSYVKEEGDTVETFRGDSITVNLDSWATTLTQGISERAISGEQTTYRFEGTVISRSEEEVTILRDASITNMSRGDSYWSLNASKLWLLPGSDFALQNAVLKVGEIPLFYIPFFYYAADEIIFHPVLGYRSREGNFIQTTTYLVGRPKPEDIKESSLTKIMGSGAGMEKEQHGIFLRTTGKKAPESPSTVKLLLDAYSNLGFYAGLDVKSPGLGVLRNFELSMGLGRTRDIKAVSLSSFSSLVGAASYTPYPQLDGVSEWNSSQLFSWNIPLRYRFKTTGSVSGKLGELSWDIPYYSDPYVDQDFLNRSEFMDWFRIIQEGAATSETTSATTLSGYEWRLTGRPALSAPKVLAPYVSSLSLSSIYSSFSFNYRDSEQYRAAGNTYSPGRRFYFPDRFTLYSLSLGIGGTPLSLGNQAGPARPEEPAEDPLAGIGTLRPPWAERETPASRQAEDPATLTPPALDQRFDLSTGGGPRFSIDYRINPATVSELQYRTGTDPLTNRYHWAEAEDVNWGDLSSILSTIRGDASTTLTLSHPQGAYTTSFRLRGSGAYQSYFYTNEEAEEFATSSNVRQALNRIYSATFFTSSYDYSGTVKPLYRDEIWRDSSISYSFDGLLAKSVFDTDSIPLAGALVLPQTIWQAEPRWDIEYGAWDKEHLSSHQLSTVVSANVMDKVQNLTLTMALPPLDTSLAGNATARVWIAEFNANMRIQEPFEEDKRKLEPLYFTGTFRFGNLGQLRQYLVFDMDKKVYNTLTTQLSLWGFTAGFTAVNSVPYEFDYNPATNTGRGWVQQGDAQLHPQDLRVGFTKSLPSLPFQDKRLSLSFNVNTSLLIDLQRYTYSRFDINLGFTFGFKEVLDLSFSATSDNSVIYRYLRNIPGLELPLPSTGETNVFRDLLNSFRFGNEALRTESGFKLKSLNLKATHYMGDWNATLGVTLVPYLESGGGTPYYQFNTQVSFLVQWLPISEIKSEFTVDKDQWVFK
ncbi:MAG: LPS-assembly protein LptD [Treponema sp.]|jgi:hypothetical protein|nr:LPS-assembly protein LptD [Treponema sp.]